MIVVFNVALGIAESKQVYLMLCVVFNAVLCGASLSSTKADCFPHESVQVTGHTVHTWPRINRCHLPLCFAYKRPHGIGFQTAQSKLFLLTFYFPPGYLMKFTGSFNIHELWREGISAVTSAIVLSSAGVVRDTGRMKTLPKSRVNGQNAAF